MLAALLVLSMASAQVPSQPPRDPRLGGSGVRPSEVAALIQQARQQENSGDLAAAEATLLKARGLPSGGKQGLIALAAFYNRQGQFDKAMAGLEERAQMTPPDPEIYQIIATFNWEKAFRDHGLLPAEQYSYVMRGIAATDQALALKPDYVEALTYKNILLRMRANLESDPVTKQQLLAEADALRNKAIELGKARAGINSIGATTMLGPIGPTPPPPPPPPTYNGMAPVRVGGNIPPPTKIKDVRPVYPPEAQDAKIQGVVIIEAVIDPAGRVGEAKVLRSIPGLDQAALDAVKQWEFTPTVLPSGTAVPVIMTVTVNFTLQ